MVTKLLPIRNLGRKYGTKWALVTGASSGIGKCIVEMLASEEHGHLNVVLVALNDHRLDQFHRELEARYPQQRFVKCALDLTRPDSVDVIVKAVHGLDIGIVVNNAGFMRFGEFDAVSIEEHVAHIECNTMSHVRIAHHFYSKWKQSAEDEDTSGIDGTARQKRRALVFTCSSQAHFLAPYTTIYGATKSFLITFANSLAIEASAHGVDVLAVCPEV